MLLVPRCYGGSCQASSRPRERPPGCSTSSSAKKPRAPCSGPSPRRLDVLHSGLGGSLNWGGCSGGHFFCTCKDPSLLLRLCEGSLVSLGSGPSHVNSREEKNGRNTPPDPSPSPGMGIS